MYDAEFGREKSESLADLSDKDIETKITDLVKNDTTKGAAPAIGAGASGNA